jgi:chemotaxis protein methyltransferase CheR
MNEPLSPDTFDITTPVKEFEFTLADFDRVRIIIHERAGISLTEGKEAMVYNRLARRLRALGYTSFSPYLSMIERGDHASEIEAFTNALTTNLTSFFREAHHFPLLADLAHKSRDKFSVWTAATSTGEEAYSIAMTLCEVFDTLTPPVQILATDIDTNVLAIAKNGVYPVGKIDKLLAARRRRFFLKGKGAQEGMVRVRPELRQLVTFKPLNLLGPGWGIQGPFDAIFCRNVMIYFDRPSQGKILARFAPLMKPGGLLFAGHSENFRYASAAFRLRGKTVYEIDPAFYARRVLPISSCDA